MKWILRRGLNKFGVDVRRWPQLIDFLRSREVEVVLDVGANVGQFATTLRRLGYRGQIVSFEPVTSVFEQLQGNAANDSLWSVRNYALGAGEGTAEIHVSDYSVFSSILPLTQSGANFDQSARVVRSETIVVKPLDSIFDEFRHARVFLKIDTQGFEREVLRGAVGALNVIVGVQLELPIEHLYDGVWMLEEAVSFMRERQFVISQIRPNGAFRPIDRVSVSEIDVVFCRAVPDEAVAHA